MVFRCQKLLHERILSESHDAVSISGWHLCDRLLQICLRLIEMRLIAVGEIHHKDSRRPAAAPVDPYAQKRQQDTQEHRTAHGQIKFPMIAHLTHIDDPLDHQKHQCQQYEKMPDSLLHLLPARDMGAVSRNFRPGSDPAVRFCGSLETHHIRFLIHLISDRVQPRPARPALKLASVRLRPRLQGDLLPRIINVCGKP